MNIYGYWVLLLSFDENSGGHPSKIDSLNTGSNILFLFLQSQIGVSIPSDQGQYFQKAVGNLFDYQSSFVDPRNTQDKFNVLCHGDLWMQNVVFSYGSCMESQSDVVDVRFDDLHHARYASCATDIHNLLYYTVDADIRRDHTVNLLAVYHDHFAKVLQSLPKVCVSHSMEISGFSCHLDFT